MSDFVSSYIGFNPDAIVANVEYANYTAEALKLSSKIIPYVPFIIVIKKDAVEYAIRCMKLGADDYVLKSNLSRLPRAISIALKKKGAELERNQLIQQLELHNKVIVKVNEQLDMFLYSASHNLRAPLKSIEGLVSLIRMELKSHSNINIENYVNLLETSVEQLDNTLRQVSDFTKNARLELVFREINFKELINEVFEEVQPLDIMSQVIKQMKVQHNVELFSDKMRLKLVLLTLVSNAIIYSDPTKRKQILIVKVRKSKYGVKVVVQDNGIGISQNQMPNIFGMFYRGSEKSVGSGLGLFISKEIVNRLRGTIEVQSKEKIGTKVTVFIPV